MERQSSLDERFEEFVAQRADALLRYGYLLSGNPHDAADLTQEALVRLHRAWPHVRQKQAPEAYTRMIMVRLHIRTWRLRRRERLDWALPDTTQTDRPPSDDGLLPTLAGLPKKQRAVLVLRYYEDMSDEEIAAVLGVSRGTVRSHASLGLAKLRTTLPNPTANGSSV
jgi:RNA polymerase sigma-70 factor (sigma-E family)